MGSTPTTGTKNMELKSPLYKRIFDLSILILAHVILFPLWIVLWIIIPLLIFLEDGFPIFYGQKRAGMGRKEFFVYKFRTMVKEADKIGPSWTMEDDPRLTKVGKILRKTALDELPSLLSIFRGDMSFVGPRALAIDEQKILETKIPDFAKRLRVRPGLTGLAQVYNPEDDPVLKIKYDLEYIEKMSLWLDIKLMFLSVINTITGRWDKRKGKESMKGK
ncbi:MAG: sugar transferase [Nitrospirae bacterium]|nr:sugar transferase [Nitrospirota bacterium]